MSGHGRSDRQGHQLVAFRPYEHLLGQPVLFEELCRWATPSRTLPGWTGSRFQAAEGLLQVFAMFFCGEINGQGAVALWPICEDVSYACARRYEITELLERTGKLNLPIGWPGGFASEPEYSDGEFKFTEAIINYVGRCERHLLLGLDGGFPGPARPPMAFGSWAFPYLGRASSQRVVRRRIPGGSKGRVSGTSPGREGPNLGRNGSDQGSGDHRGRLVAQTTADPEAT